MKIFILILTSFSLYGGKIDIVSSFHFDELDPEWKIRCETFLDVRSLTMGFGKYLDERYTEDVDKVVSMQSGASPADLLKLPKEKRVLVIWEPGGESEEYCALFDKVYTYNDLLVEQKGYRKFHYPVLTPMCPSIPAFDEKKFSVMVSHSWTEKRVGMIQFFDQLETDEFDYFGFTPMVPSPSYRGPIPSHPVSPEKFNVLKHYKFCICFENSEIPGYITEKIFSCFAGGCIPVYWGAPNIEDYIPKGCFIDFRDFPDEAALYDALKKMTREEYEGYLGRIRDYLKSDKARVFSAEHFNEMLLQLEVAQ